MLCRIPNQSNNIYLEQKLHVSQLLEGEAMYKPGICNLLEKKSFLKNILS